MTEDNLGHVSKGKAPEALRSDLDGWNATSPPLFPSVSPSVLQPRKLPKEQPVEAPEVVEVVEIGDAAAAATMIAAVAAVGYGLYRFGKWLFSPDVPTDSTSIKEWVTITDQDLLALSIHFESEGDIWPIYENNKAGLEQAVGTAVNSYLGSELDSFIMIQKGSLWAKLIIRFRSFGKKVSSGTKRAKINMIHLAERIKDAVNNFVAKAREGVSSPKVKATLNISFKVLRATISIASSLVGILEFFGVSGASALGGAMRSWFST